MLILHALVAVGFLISGAVGAQEFPARSMTIVVPFPPGGSTDLITRSIAQRLAENVGQPVIIANKPGGGGVVGAVAVKSAPPDGYTVLLGNTGTHALGGLLHGKLEYDPAKDYRPVTALWSFASFLVVPAASPARNVGELLAYARSRTDGLSFTSQGHGTAGHFLGEMLKSETNTKLVHIPMKGAAPAVMEIVAGRADFLFSSYISSSSFIRSGKLRVLALASGSRSSTLPDTPTLEELGIHGVQFDQWNGIFAPAKVPDAVLRRLNDEFVKAIRHPEVAQMLSSQAAEVITGSPDDFAKRIASDGLRYGNIVRRLGVKAD